MLLISKETESDLHLLHSPGNRNLVVHWGTECIVYAMIRTGGQYSVPKLFFGHTYDRCVITV